jgi:hypothetical protein
VRKALQTSKCQLRLETLRIAFSVPSEIRKSDLKQPPKLMQGRCQTWRLSTEFRKAFIFIMMLVSSLGDGGCKFRENGGFPADLVVFNHSVGFLTMDVA